MFIIYCYYLLYTFILAGLTYFCYNCFILLDLLYLTCSRVDSNNQIKQ